MTIVTCLVKGRTETDHPHPDPLMTWGIGTDQWHDLIKKKPAATPDNEDSILQ